MLRYADPFNLLGFAFIDACVHVLLDGETDTSAFSGRALRALHWRLGLPIGFERSQIGVLDDGWSLERTLLLLMERYAHEARCDPGMDGSSIVDMVGLRVGGSGMGDR